MLPATASSDPSAQSFAAARAQALRPAAPRPREKPADRFSLLWGLWRNPLTTWTRRSFDQKIGQTDSVLGPVTVVSDPMAIRHVLVENVANYRKDALQLRILRPGLGNGVFTAEGEDWRMQRRALAPLFTPRAVADFLPAMAQSAAWLEARWRPLREGRRLDVASEMSRVTLDVLERTIFPQGLARDPASFARAMGSYFDAIGRLHPLDIVGAPDWLPRIGKSRPDASLRFFASAVEDIIRARRRWLKEENQGEAPRDLLTRLLAARDPQTGEGLDEASVAANVLTFIGAGHETTANGLTWSLYLLALHPEWRAQVEQEVDEALAEGVTEAALPRLIRTRATFEEALRLYPPAASLSREAIGADELCGRLIRPGETVVISPWVLHRHRQLWDRPDYFDPTRFMPGRRESIDRFAYLPFGAGPRVCIGMGFALQEAVILLASVVKQVRLDLAPGHKVEPVMRITLRPRGGMPMILHRR